MNRQRDIKRGVCCWRYEYHDGVYITRCREEFQFTYDGILENKFTFCPFCGLKIIQPDEGSEG